MQIPEQQNLLDELVFLLKKGNAHVSFNDAIQDIPFDDLGKKAPGLPYSIWQIAEHIRITQKDILDFSANENYKELNWPADYWPHAAVPENKAAWDNCIKQINADLDAFIGLLTNSTNIFKPFEHGTGQSMLREAMLIADHTSYHTGEIIVLRRLLGNWKN
ncbi:DinB family protein [Parafilimonas sp.]|uniref:DinB family protein n=1 Tax=Parafilimonas sp. TaxID=1969739 RepID=UPI003F81EEC9